MRHQWIAIVVLLLSLTAPLSAEAGQRGGQRGEGAQTAAANIPIPRFPDGTPNLSWVDPSQKGYWRSEMHWEYGREQIDPKAREEGLPYQPWAKALHDFRMKTESKNDPEVFFHPYYP